MGIGGESTLDFLIKVDNYSFLEAANIIAENIKVKAPEYVPPPTPKKKEIKNYRFQ